MHTSDSRVWHLNNAWCCWVWKPSSLNVHMRCEALKENTQLRLFGSLSTGWFSWSVILTADFLLWVPLFGPLKQIKEVFVLSSLTVTVLMLMQSWYFFCFELLAFSPSFSWSLRSVFSCTPFVKQTSLNHMNSHSTTLCLTASKPTSYEPLLDDSTYLQQVTLVFLSLFLISANINNKFICDCQKAQLSLIYLQ